MNTFYGNAQRKLGIVLAGGAALMLMSGIALAAVASTKHNLGSTNVTGSNKFDGTGDICVFCHTPHGGDASAAVPLWNRNLGTNTYQRYSALLTSSFDAQETSIGSVSIACLSCHDGTQSMSVMLNTPGSGNVALSGTWTGANVNTGTGQMSTSPFPNLGTDLRNDHPVGMQWAGGGVNATAPAGATTDPDFASAVNSATPAVGQVGNKTVGSLLVWWVEKNGTTGLQKDDIPLYSRTDASITGGNQPFVECASCHDPHSSNTTFLRQTNTGSALCLTCHNK